MILSMVYRSFLQGVAAIDTSLHAFNPPGCDLHCKHFAHRQLYTLPTSTSAYSGTRDTASFIDNMDESRHATYLKAMGIA